MTLDSFFNGFQFLFLRQLLVAFSNIRGFYQPSFTTFFLKMQQQLHFHRSITSIYPGQVRNQLFSKLFCFSTAARFPQEISFFKSSVVSDSIVRFPWLGKIASCNAADHPRYHPTLSFFRTSRYKRSSHSYSSRVVKPMYLAL